MDKGQAHDKGQSDAAEGKFELPHGHVEELFSYGDHATHVHENNQAYIEGHNHSTGQKEK